MAGAQLERVKSAASRLRAFFDELRGAFVEREDLLSQAALALLSREHLLISGPPGTAKSRLGLAILGRIVDETDGQPSLYSRQFTESTVQTDLVGPIDFKTLMETGRTEHFTDEGMLGAVHGFLDEVFDGRDMLLRATLNVLNERELKQGTKTTRGRIECAILTSNRYLAEVLEGSREALLAFIDRIAFVGFVPKGFGDPASLGRLLHLQLVGAKQRPLSALLTIQDLDALQNAVDSVSFPAELCDLLVEFVRSFEAEIAAAVRADPTFVPTRYLSTRTVVRLGQMLRAACVYDWAVNGQSRPLRVARRDFSALRLALVLCGPPPEHIDKLLEVESDPRERRQLEIVRTEQAIFVRCLAKLRNVELPTEPDLDDALIEASEGPALRTCQPKKLVETTRKLAELVARGAGDGAAAERLRTSVFELRRRAIQSGCDTASHKELTPLAAAGSLAELAEGLERLNPDLSSVARWLRGQALELIQQALRLAPTTSGQNLEHWLKPAQDVAQAQATSTQRLRRISGFLELQTRLIAEGADQPTAAADEHWRRALGRLVDDLVLLWDGVLRPIAARALEGPQAQDLSNLLDSIAAPLLAMREIGGELTRLGAPASILERRVLGARLSPVVLASCERFKIDDRHRVIEQLEHLFDMLGRYGLAQTLPPAELLGWVASVLLRAEPDWASLRARHSPDFRGYRALRAEHGRESLTYMLTEVCLCLERAVRAEDAPGDRLRQVHSEEVLQAVKVLVAGLPAALRERVIAADTARIDAPLSLLEAFWQSLVEAQQASPDDKLANLAASRFLHVTRDEAALVRLALEARLLAQVLPEARVSDLEQRIAVLEQQTDEALRDLMGRSLDTAWLTALDGAKPR